MSNPDRRPCHNKDFLRYNNIINGADWHNVPGSKKECVFKRKINESIFFKLYITHDIILLLKSLTKKKRKIVFRHEKEILQTCFSPGKIRFPNVFTTLIWSNSPAWTVFFFTLSCALLLNKIHFSFTWQFFFSWILFFWLLVSHTMFLKKSGYFSTHAILFTNFHIYENSLEKNVHIFSQILCALTKKVHT